MSTSQTLTLPELTQQIHHLAICSHGSIGSQARNVLRLLNEHAEAKRARNKEAADSFLKSAREAVKPLEAYLTPPAPEAA